MTRAPKAPRTLALRLWALVLSLLACVDSPSRAPAHSPFKLADSLRILEQYRPALVHYARLRDSLGAAGDTAGLWKAELWWGYSQLRMGNPDSASQAMAHARALAGTEPERLAWTHVLTSNLLSLQGQFDTATVEAQRGRDLARGNPDLELQQAVSYAMGWVYAGKGRHRDAFAVDSEAVARLRTLGSRAPLPLLAQALNALGNDYYWLGRFSESAQNKEDALAIYRALGQIQGATRVLVSLAEVHYRTANIERALELYNEALSNAERVGQRTNEVAILHNNISLVFLDHGNLDTAQVHLEKALEISRATGQAYGQILALSNLGRIELLRDKPAAARRLMKEALALGDSLGFISHANSIRIDLIYAHADLGDIRGALSLADTVLTAAKAEETPTILVSATEAKGLALELAGRVSEATTFYLHALDLIESWRVRVTLGGQRIGLGDRYIYLYERTIRTLLSQNRNSEALGIAERARARLLLELMAARAGSRHDSRSAQLQDKLRDRLAERAAAKLDRKPALDSEISEISARLAGLDSAARRDDPAAGPARHPAPARVSDINRNLVGPNRSLLAFFWGLDDVYGWWVTTDTVRAARLGPADSLAALVDFLGATIDSPRRDTAWRSPARRAYRALIEPLKPTDDDETLVIPDGPLTHTPLEAFLPATDTPWGVSRRLIYGPSASVLLALAQTQPTTGWRRTMLAVGNPSVGRGRVQDSLRAANDLEPGPLPYAEGEARAISALFRESGADLLLGRRATIAQWKKLDPTNYRYLHFATHARVNDRRPDRTHLVLSQGVLAVPEIRSLRLRAELVTLSACETALGRRVRGEGVIGLPHAFLAAGARGVLVTLWRIGDQSAAEFMREFYQELSSGHSAAQALRLVRQRWVAGSGASAHPSRWAPFVLVGGLSP